MRGWTLSMAAAIVIGSPALALAQQAVAPNAPAPPPVLLNRGGGIAGTAFGTARAGAGATSATPANPARSAAMVSGTAHIGAGTGGLGLGMGNAVGGFRDTATGAGAGGLGDRATLGSNTGGIAGVGLGINAPTGGIHDAFNQGILTGGVQGTAIGAGVGGLSDLNALGASTGGTKEGDNAPRYRVVQ